MNSILRRLSHRLRKRPAPQALVALYLSARWRCHVSPRASIDFPGNLRLGRRARLHACRIIARGPVAIGARASVMDFAVLGTESARGYITIGSNTLVGALSVIYGGGGVTIGDDSLLAPQVTIISTNHRSDDLHRPIATQGIRFAPTRIGRDVWLGAQCTILGGTTIGDGTIIGANSVVKDTVPAGVVAAGSPLRILHRRSREKAIVS